MSIISIASSILLLKIVLFAMSKYSSIKTFHIAFEHPELLRTCGDIIDRSVLFSDESIGKLNTNFITDVRNAAISSIGTSCTSTKDTNRIGPMVSQMPLVFINPNRKESVFKLRDLARLEAALDHCVNTKMISFQITFQTDVFYFPPSFGGRNFDDILLTPPGPSSVPAPALAPPLGPIPTHFGSITATSPVQFFDIAGLPGDVRLRYDSFNNPTSILNVASMHPFADPTDPHLTTKHYHVPSVTGPQVILLNGAVLSGVIDSKNFFKNLPTCKTLTAASIRRWYMRMTRHAHSWGYMMMPYELLTRGYGAPEGFVFGTDLPFAHQAHLQRWSHDLSRALQDFDLFPKDSHIFQRIQNIDNGYQALIAIVATDHPRFVSNPILLAQEYPSQGKDQSVYAFHNEFTDFCRLRATFFAGSDDLATPSMIDLFIAKCTHSSYLFAASRTDRQDPFKRPEFAPSSLATTLHTYLERPESPAKRSGEGPPRSSEGSNRPYFNRDRRTREVHSEYFDSLPDPAQDAIVDSMVNQLNTGKHDQGDARFCTLCKTKHVFGECAAFQHPSLQRRLMSRICSEVQRFHEQLEIIKKDPSSARIHSLKESTIHSLESQLTSLQSSLTALTYPTTEDSSPAAPPAQDFVPGRS
jgi:hypothetical protein